MAQLRVERESLELRWAAAVTIQTLLHGWRRRKFQRLVVAVVRRVVRLQAWARGRAAKTTYDRDWCVGD